ncbi:hypothetical protein LTR17_006118 [Elasticomyces elasticus]|nr:hypothetical protein LTR17_006118 [Elasticomyces elasticus]
MPTPISGRYHRYKAGTTKITRWLKSAAKRCNDIGHALATLCIADDATDAARGSITTQDLVRLATVIATSTQPKVDIPLEILVVIEDVIEGRQASAEWYAGTEHGVDGETEKANRRHRQFIEVLKEVLSILKEKYVARLPKSYKRKPEKLELDKAVIRDNIYEYLDLEDPISSLATPSPRPGGGLEPPSAAQLHEGDHNLSKDLEQADKAFALWCFFKDQYDSCNLIKDTWQEYKDSKLSFATVSQLTETAFLLMERAQTSLIAQYPEFRDMDGVNDFLGFTVTLLGGQITVLAFPEKKVSADAGSKPALHELFCTQAACIMHDIRDALCYPTRYNDVPEEAHNVSHRFAVALRALAPEIRLLAASDNHKGPGKTKKHTAHVYEDLFLHYMVVLYKSAILSPLLVTACQAYMHIYDVLDMQVTYGQYLLHDEASRLCKTMADHLKHMAPLRDWPLSLHTIPATERCREYLLSQVDGDTPQLLHRTFPSGEREACPPDFRLQKLLPVTCGTLISTTLQSNHLFGVYDCNTGFTVLAAAYLYKAARECGALIAEWKDMDWVLGQHNSLVLPAGNSSQPLTALARHYLIALGKKATSTWTLRWYTRSNTTTPAFQYADTPPYQQTITCGRLLGESGCSPYVQHMLEETDKNNALRAESSWNHLQELVLHKIANSILEKQPAAAGAAKQCKGNFNKLTAVELLAGFKQMLKDDESNFHFDYFGFLRSCSDLMSTVLTTCDPAGDRGLLAASRLVNVVLWEAASTEKPRPGHSLDIQQTMLHDCGSLLAAHLDHAGSSVYIDAASSRRGDLQLREIQSSRDSLQALLGPIPQMSPKIFRELGHTVTVQKDVESALDPIAKVFTIHVSHIKTRSEMMTFLGDLWGSGPVPGKPKQGLGWIQTIGESTNVGDSEETELERFEEDFARLMTDGFMEIGPMETGEEFGGGDRRFKEQIRKAIGMHMREAARKMMSSEEMREKLIKLPKDLDEVNGDGAGHKSS